MAPLTAPDLVLIRNMIRQELAAAAPQPQPVTPKRDYHAISDIRKIILEHIDELREFVGDEEFPAGILKAFVKQRTTLLPGDLAPLKRSGKATRFDGQVTNLHATNWPGNPFIVVRRGYYRLRPVASQLEI